MEYPVAGAAFSYTMITFGELPAFLAVSNLLLEYVLGTAAIARGFSLYLARIFNLPDDYFLISDSPVDFMAFGVVLLLTAVLAYGVRESAFIVSVVNTIHLILLFVIIIAGYTQANTANLSPFLVGGADNMLQAGAVLFFAYAGFDVVATSTEESRKPEHVPWALVSTTVIATVTYVLLSLSLVLMVPITVNGELNPVLVDSSFANAALSTSFKIVGLNGMYYVACLAALSGTVGAMLVGLFGAARICMTAARDWLIPPFLATIYARTQTPLIATLVIGIVTALVSLLVRYTTLSDLVSLSTLVVMWLVANALLFRRYYPGLPRLRYSRWGTVESAEGRSLMPFTVPGARLPLRVRQWLVVGHLFFINGFSIGGSNLDMADVPFSDRNIYWVFACWFAGSLVVYFLFSLPMSYIRHEKLDYVRSEQLSVVELSLVGDKWVPVRKHGKAALGYEASSVRLGSRQVADVAKRKAGQAASQRSQQVLAQSSEGLNGSTRISAAPSSGTSSGDVERTPPRVAAHAVGLAAQWPGVSGLPRSEAIPAGGRQVPQKHVEKRQQGEQQQRQQQQKQPQ
ncbi:hypothetical protein N2152v2_009173 [Parachlorella kessleri]